MCRYGGSFYHRGARYALDTNKILYQVPALAPTSKFFEENKKKRTHGCMLKSDVDKYAPSAAIPMCTRASCSCGQR